MILESEINQITVQIFEALTCTSLVSAKIITESLRATLDEKIVVKIKIQVEENPKDLKFIIEAMYNSLGLYAEFPPTSGGAVCQNLYLASSGLKPSSGWCCYNV